MIAPELRVAEPTAAMAAPAAQQLALGGLRESLRDPETRVLLLATGIAYFARLWEGSFDGDSAIYASVAKGIAESGDWFFLRLGQEVYWDKPPLFFWLTALLFRVFGTSTLAACFWSALFGAASVLALHRLARELFDRRAAFYAGLAMLFTPELLRYASRPRLESISVFFLILAVLDSVRAVRGQDPRRLLRVGVWIGLLFLAKGGPGFIALAVTGAYLAWRRAGGLLLSRLGALGLLSMLVLALSWQALYWARFGAPYFDDLMVELVNVSAKGGDQNPFFYYPARLLRVYWHLLPLAALGAWRLWRERDRWPEAFQIVACWLVLGAVLISLPEALHARYLTSLYPATALLVGFWLRCATGPELAEKLYAWLPRLTLTAAVLFLCIPFPIHPDDARETRELGAVLGALAPEGAPVPSYPPVHGFARAQFHFYLDRDVEELKDLDAVARAAPPLLVSHPQQSDELVAEGWRPLIRSWRWVAHLPPEPSRARDPQPGAVAPRQDVGVPEPGSASRRL
jgi:4-amino-4-deoxy-L-arabinose transferase-like glycosyltransferase